MTFPTLANELFDDRERFVSAMEQFPKCQEIVPYLRSPSGEFSVESELERLLVESSRDRERRKQLTAVRFYLQYMLWECEYGWKRVARGITNYKTLLDQIRHWRSPQEQVCLVTFNYDTLLEESLPTIGVTIRDIPDYVANDHCKLFKLHGSINWTREVDGPIFDLSQLNGVELSNELIARGDQLEISDRYQWLTQHPIAKRQTLNRDFPLVPALAIPVESKVEYECPADHLEHLTRCIPQVNKLIIIGWRASEAGFCELLSLNLDSDVSILVAAGTQDAADQVVHNLQTTGIDGQFHTTTGGFTDLVVNRETVDFLNIL